MRRIGEHLYAQGRRRPVFLYGPRHHSTALGRRRAMTAFWQDHGIEMGGILVPAYDADSAGNALAGALAAGLRPDALICENDILAIGAMERLRHDFALRIPEDIAVTGFDDIAMARLPSFALTTWRQPVEEMVARLVEFLTGQAVPQSLRLDGSFMLRKSA